MSPLVAERNQALSRLIGAQTEIDRHNWGSKVETVASEYERCQREVAETMLADVEACALAARRVLNIQKAIDDKDEEFKHWTAWSAEELIRRFEAGDIDCSKFTTKSAAHARNVEKLVTAYKSTQPDLFAPTRDVVRRAAFEVQCEACNTPLDSIHWPRHRTEAGSNAAVTLSAETRPCVIDDRPSPGTTVGPGGFMSRRFAPVQDTTSNMRLRLPDLNDFNVASWLQATPELAIEATLLRPYGSSRWL
ncbi:hypothetical protein EG329_006548 [Mollisiaceae sp. DMI_Dod_QoI]|nr:hypothetical protein EG329_006548 [Helotiales sp. DMI_Dod_QoI]